MSITILVCESLPGLSASGGSITAFNIARALNNLNKAFYIVSLYDFWPELGAKSQHLTQLEKANLDYISANSSECEHKDNDNFFLLSELKNLQKLYSSIDHIHAYGHRASMAVVSMKRHFQFTMHSYLGDPLGSPNAYKKFSSESTVVDPISRIDSRSIDVMSTILKFSDFHYSFAAHHAAQMSSLFNDKHEYLKTPICTIQESYDRTRNNQAYKNISNLLLLGHISGTATKDGFSDFMQNYLPLLKDTNLIDNIDIVGGGVAPLDAIVKDLIMSGDVSYHGVIKDISTILTESFALLVPTKIALGIRVRILTAMSYGLPVIAHVSNSKGIPELISGYNCLLFNDRSSFLESIKYLKNENNRVNVVKNALSLIRTNFSVEVFADFISSRASAD